MTANDVLMFKIFPRVTHSQVHKFIAEISVEGQHFISTLSDALSHKRVPLKDGQAIKFLLTYSSMFNPIEKLLSEVKKKPGRTKGPSA